jgi:protein tyrosine phosphatase (PTP) superfamily phosphohydrolase (DUF442 family)
MYTPPGVGAFVLGLAASLAMAGATPATEPPDQPPEPAHPPAGKDDKAPLHNLHRLSETLISGSGPEGDAAFDELARLGVRTIISVDGARPDLQRARDRGMRYVHLPVGYQGIPRARQLELARAVRDLPGPIYLHCHHGKHRGPAAAASADVLLGGMTPEEAEAFLKQAGTSPRYPGLYACVRGLVEADPAAINAASPDFPEVTPLPKMIAAMAAMQVALDHLTLVRDAGWATPVEHPDLLPAAEAAQVAEMLRATREDPDAFQEDANFARMLVESWRRADDLEKAVLVGRPGEELTKALELVIRSCDECHVEYRDRRGY